MTLEERFWARTTPGWNGCVISTYSVGSHGYARCGRTTAHRVAWMLTHGPIPEGLTVDHRCRVRRCVNPHHLRLLTNPENASDNGQVRTNPETGRRCHKDHPMVRSSTGATYCRECVAAGKRRRRTARS